MPEKAVMTSPAAPAPLKRRADFVRLTRGGAKWAGRTVVVQMAPRPTEATAKTIGTRVGYTASRKVGNAVVRNRAKRRLRAVARELIDNRFPATDIVLIARPATATCAFADLRTDIEKALTKLAGKAAQGANP